MNISKEKVYDVLNNQLQELQDDDWIWNISLNNPDRSFTLVDIENISKILDTYKDFVFEKEDDILEVSTLDGNLVLEIKGLPNISQYCNTENFKLIDHNWYDVSELSNVSIKKHYNMDFYSVISKKKETKVDEDKLAWIDIGKYYKQYKQITYRHTSGINYVIKIIRSNYSISYTNMKQALLSNRPTEYSMSVVLNGNIELENKLIEMIRYMMFMYQEFENDKYPMVIEEQGKIIEKYNKLILKARELSKFEQYNPKTYFLAPKPVTLEIKNLIDYEQAIGVTSILQNYAVTDKADGERMLLYIDDTGTCYLINNTYQVKNMGIKAKSNAIYNTLLDGEYITMYQMKDTKKDMFAAFDIYFLGGDNIMNLPLMDGSKPSRYSKLKLIMDNSYWEYGDTTVEITAKNHIQANGTDMFKACKEILENNWKYEIDGLIFTPVDLAVFSYYPNQYKKVRGSSVVWEKVFKWKPPQQNTIDFLVKEKEGIYTDENNNNYKRFELYTGYNSTQWENIPVYKGVQKVFYKDKYQIDEEYQAKLFKPIENYNPNVSIALVPINKAGQAITENNEVIENHMIVEMSYTVNKNKNVSLCWNALRVREDKTRLLRISNKITKTANDLSVALNIWHNIYNPVKVEHIIGQYNISNSMLSPGIEERLLGINDVYYARDIPRNHMLSVHMLNFHNHGIKSMLYKVSQNKGMLLELACGMAGDLPRWRDNNYKFILGIDLVKDNIESPNGSYSRFLHQRHEFFKKQRNRKNLFYPQAIFLIGDCGLPLETGEASKGKDGDSEMLLKMLYQGRSYEKYNYLNNYRLVGKAAQLFDTVSCQFAVHYFFKTKEYLEGFLRNVSYNLKPNGIFIATFMDGQSVHKLINKPEKVEGKNNGNMVWAIQKMYKSFTKTSPYGKLIDVFLENTNQFIPEYLVHFEILKEKAREYQLELVEDGFFKETFNNLYQDVLNNRNRNVFLDRDLHALANDTVQKQFSFLNRWVIFRKMEPGEVSIESALQELKV